MQQDNKPLNGAAAGRIPDKDCHLHFSINMEMLVNRDRLDPRLKQVFYGKEFADLLDAQVSTMILTMIRAFAVQRDPEITIDVVRQGMPPDAGQQPGAKGH